MLTTNYSIVIFFAALIFASITDIKSHKIKIWVFPIATVLSVPALILTIMNTRSSNLLYDISPYIMGFFAGFSLFLFIALKGKGGGGDAIMMGSIGLIFGMTRLVEIFIIAIAIMSLFVIGYIIYSVIKRSKMNFYFPLAPFILGGFVIDIIYNFISFGGI